MKALPLLLCSTLFFGISAQLSGMSIQLSSAIVQEDEAPFENPKVVANIQSIINESYQIDDPAERKTFVKTKCGSIEETVEKSIAILAKMLKSKNVKEIRIAAQALNSIGIPALHLVPELIALQDEGIVVSRFEFAMARGIRQELQQAATAPKLLIKFLKHENRGVVWWTYETLLRMNARAANLLPYLVQIMDDDRNELAVRQFASEIIGTMGEKAKWAIPALVGQMTDTQSEVDAVTPLSRIGEAVLEDTIPELDNENYVVKHRVLDLLARMRENSLPGLSKVRQLLNDEDKKVRFDAAFAYWRMTTKTDEISSVLKKSIIDPELCDRACFLVYEMGDIASSFSSEIVAALKQDDFTERTKEMYILTLGKIGPTAMTATVVLEKYCSSESLKLKHCAAVSLWKVSGNAKLPVETLLSILQKDLPRLKHRYYTYSIRAIGDIGPAASEAVPTLKEFFSNDRHAHFCAVSLAKIGGAGEKFLRDIVAGEDSKKRKRAQWALDKYIDGKEDDKPSN